MAQMSAAFDGAKVYSLVLEKQFLYETILELSLCSIVIHSFTYLAARAMAVG